MESIIFSIFCTIISALLSIVIFLLKQNRKNSQTTLEAMHNKSIKTEIIFATLQATLTYLQESNNTDHNNLFSNINEINKTLTKNYGDIAQIKNELGI